MTFRSSVTRIAVSAGCLGLLGTGFGTTSSAYASDSVVLDTTPSGPLDTQAGPNSQGFGWQFITNVDTSIASITVWQSQDGQPVTSSITIHETNNDGTIGAALGTFVHEAAGSDSTAVANYQGIDFFAINYRGESTLAGTDTYWLVMTPGTSPLRLVAAQGVQYSPGTPGRTVLTGNNNYNADVSPPTSQYYQVNYSWIYVLRTATAAAAVNTQSQEIVITVAFALPKGMTCSIDSAMDQVESWMRLPSANECSFSLTASGAEPRLLGWATAPEFPASIAQRQVDNGWGAYEMTDADGRVTSVFIPAGGSAYISGDARFFPVFAD